MIISISNRFFKIDKFITLFSLFAFLSLSADAAAAFSRNDVRVYFFWGEGCSNCKHEKPFLAQLERKYPDLKIKSYEVWHSRENADLYAKMALAYKTKIEVVPATFIGDFEPIVGYLDDEVTGKSIETAVRHCIEYGCIDPIEKMKRSSAQTGAVQPQTLTGEGVCGQISPCVEETETARPKTSSKEKETIKLRFIGNIDASKMSLPALTTILAGADGFSPCAFIWLLLLSSILVYSHSRKIMSMIGGMFIFFSGFISFLFMSSWLDVFLLFGQLKEITIIGAATALIIAVVNIKDFFSFEREISPIIPGDPKTRLFEPARNLVKISSVPMMIVGTILFALAARTYELICTAGFPMIYTRVLTLRSLPSLYYYLYLIFYNLIYVIPLILIVVIFSIMLGRRRLTQRQGKPLKLISGIMMLYLGLVLMLKPDLLSNVFISAGLLIMTLATAGIIILITRNFKKAV